MKIGLGLFFFCLSSAWAHSIETHKEITKAAVLYLKKFIFMPCPDDLNKLLAVGAEHEDDDPRFMFHFDPMLNDKLIVARYAATFSANCSSRQWGFSDAPCFEGGDQIGGLLFKPETLSNTHTWAAAITARDVNGNPSIQGYQELGYVLHLLEDLTSPAHVRNDAHPEHLDYDPLEKKNRIPTMPDVSAGLISFTTADAFFESLKLYTQSNFYSKDSVFSSLGGPLAVRSDSVYFYDARDRRIATKWRRYWESGTPGMHDPTKAEITDDVADEQWTELGPVAVQYVASLIKFYIDTVNPPPLFACRIAAAPPPFTGVPFGTVQTHFSLGE